MMNNTEAREMVIAAINEVDVIESTASDEEIVDLGLHLATMNWNPEALEWLARKWSYLEDEDTETVANMICEWQFGYRCEEEDQPSVLLKWASTESNQWADEVDKEINSRIDPMVSSVKADLAKGIQEDKAWCDAVEDGEWTEYEVVLAKDIVARTV